MNKKNNKMNVEVMDALNRAEHASEKVLEAYLTSMGNMSDEAVEAICDKFNAAFIANDVKTLATYKTNAASKAFDTMIAALKLVA